MLASFICQHAVSGPRGGRRSGCTWDGCGGPPAQAGRSSSRSGTGALHLACSIAHHVMWQAQFHFNPVHACLTAWGGPYVQTQVCNECCPLEGFTLCSLHKPRKEPNHRQSHFRCHPVRPTADGSNTSSAMQELVDFKAIYLARPNAAEAHMCSCI